MKKSIILIIALAVICLLAFTACQNEVGSGEPDNPIDTPIDQTPEIPTLQSISASLTSEVTVGDISLPLQVTATLTDGTSFTVTNFQLGEIDTTTPGEKTVSVSYTFLEITKTVEVVYTVNPKPSIFIDLYATYSGEVKVGDTEIPNLSVKAIYSDGSDKKITDFKVEGFDTTTEGTKTVSFSYTEGDVTLGCFLKIKVVSNITVTALQGEISLDKRQVEGYDYTSLFAISKNGVAQEITTDLLDLSKVNENSESFEVVCTFEGKTAKATVIVLPPACDVILSEKNITLKQSEVENFDYISYFTVTDNGNPVEITSDMVESDICDAVGEYTVTVSYLEVSATLNIKVIPDHILQAIPSFTQITIEEYQKENFDPTSLFSLYVDGVSEKVTLDMLDLTAFENCGIGESAVVTLSYQKAKSSVEASATVSIIADAEVVVNCKNLTVYPNSEYLDLTTLFEVSLGGEKIAVTQDMVSGNVDYTQTGINTITLTFREQTYTATVEVKTGVVIGFAKGDSIEISKGTNQNSYAFADDFIVIINGIRFKNVASYVDSSAVDFSTPGEYLCKISVPYNDKKGGWGGIKYTYYEEEITYKVVDNTYAITITNDLVSLKAGTTSYNVFSNLKVKINGKNQTLTQNPDYADVITCYVEEVSQPLDYTKPGKQKVEIAVYVDGPSLDPVVVSYHVIVDSDLTLTPVNIFAYTGDTIYTEDMFVLKNGEEVITLPQECISGKVDTFKAGTYYVYARYEGLEATAKAVVRDINILGTYKTPLKTIGSTSDLDDEGYEIGETIISKRLGNLVITRDSMTLLGAELKILDCFDENSMLVYYRSYNYFLTYSDGIVLLVPENKLEMSYSENNRPFIYYSEDVWTIESNFVINQRAEYVLNNVYPGYSIDVSLITNKEGESKYHALKTNLISHMNADTIYEVSCGDITFSENFTGAEGEVVTFTYEKERVAFTVTSTGDGSINKEEDVREYANKTFTGTYDGKSASLIADQYEGYTFVVDGKTIFKIGHYDLINQPGGGANYLTKTISIFNSDDRHGDPIYSYKFEVDPENNTFTYIPHDGLVGKYNGESMYFFLDGYGKGLVNFDTKSYYRTQFSYVENNGLLEITYLNPSYDFTHGEGAKFALDEFGNLITCIDSEKGEFNGIAFENSVIIDGAVVKVSTFKMGENASVALAKADFLSKITIITPNGTLSDSEKTAAVDLTTVAWNKPGFCRFSITVTRGGEQVVKYYTVQILPVLYADNPMAITFGAGVLYPDNSLAFDKFGQAFFNANGNLFEGTVIFGEDSFNAKLYDKKNNAITLSGNLIYNGLINVTVNGAVNIKDFYSTCENASIGYKAPENTVLKDCYLRRFKIGDEYKYFYAYALTATGEEITPQVLNGITPENKGSIFSFTLANGNTLTVKVQGWGDDKKGLALSDIYRGSYTNGEKTLTLDGFGNANAEGVSATYIGEGDFVFVTTPATYTVYQLSREDMTYSVYNIAMDNTLVEGKVYTATYNFATNEGLYEATSTIYFDVNGVVIIRSQSEEYKSDNGSYAPAFANVQGTYTVKNNQISISIGGQSFAFSIENVLKCNSIVCGSSSMTDTSIGYFAIGTKFTVVEQA